MVKALIKTGKIGGKIKVPPVRQSRKSSISSPLVKAANKIVTSPTFSKIKGIDFDKKFEYEAFIKFIESSNKELLRINIPTKEEAKKMAGGAGQTSSGGRGFPLLQTLLGGKLLKSLLKKFKLPKFLRRIIVGLKRNIRNLLKPFRQLRRFFKSIPGKIKKFAVGAFKNVRKYFDDVLLDIKNLKNAKWVKSLVQRVGKLKTVADDALKVGKEVITNSKVVKASTKIIEKVGKKAGPKLASLTLGEITVIGGVVADLSMAAYRFKKGDVTGGVLSTLSAIPILGIPVAAVDIARDFNVFDDDSTILGKIDFLNVLKSKKQKDKEREEKLNVPSLEEALTENINAFPELSNQKKENRLRENMLIKQIREEQKNNTDPLMDSNYENQVQEVFRLSDKELKEKTDKLLLMSDNKEIKELIEKLNPESIGQSSTTTVIDNKQTFLLPFNNGGNQSMIPSGGEGSRSNVSVSNLTVDFNFSDLNSKVIDELLTVKLYGA